MQIILTSMDRKQKEALIIAFAEKGRTYREIAKEAGVSPNTIKGTKLLRYPLESLNYTLKIRPHWR
jgi:predicted transcriptional regulator